MENKILIDLINSNINIKKIVKNSRTMLSNNDIKKNELLNQLLLEHNKLQDSSEEYIKLSDKTNKILDYCDKNSINIITIFDDVYPSKLIAISDPPLILFYRGNINLITNTICIAVIGSRKPTNHGAKIAVRFGEVLAEKGITVVSGLATGIDVNGHIGSLSKNGSNIAILPTGMDKIYPQKNKEIYNKIIDNNGCIFSEYLPFSNIYKRNFIYRDRLESGISNGIIIVEAASKSGTMHTANYAYTQHKPIGVYVHGQKFINYKETQGNRELLKNELIIPLRNPDSIANFIHLTKQNTNISTRYEQSDLFDYSN